MDSEYFPAIPVMTFFASIVPLLAEKRPFCPTTGIETASFGDEEFTVAKTGIAEASSNSSAFNTAFSKSKNF